MQRIPLTKGKFAFISDIDTHLLGYNWYLQSDGYAAKTWREPGKRKIAPPHTMFLHHVIMGRPLNGFQIDHKDGNRLNCTRENMRFVTPRENSQNKKCHRSGKHIGVTKSGRKWGAKIQINGKLKWLGSFNSELEAAQAYQNEIRELKEK